MNGVYCIVMWLGKGQNIKVGKNLRGFFPRGYYCYVGSAMNNLEKRIERHKSKTKKKRWHVDYLTERASFVGAHKIETARKGGECELARKVRQLGGNIIIRGFGSSDCGCETHLFYFEKNPLYMLK